MSNKPGRNAPCPCGSGVKYKRCCGRGRSALRGYTQADRDSALRKLVHFLEGPGWAGVIDDAEALFWGEVEDHPGLPPGADESGLAQMSQMAFDGWLFYDFQLDPGRHVVDVFLESAQGLSLPERRYLQAMKATAMRLYEIIDVRPGDSVTLRDLVGGEVVRVRERTASRMLQCWTWVAARVNARGPSGLPEFDSGVLPMPPMRHEEILATINEELAWQRKSDPEAGERQHWAELAPVFHGFWRSPMPLPRMVNYDGHPMVFTTVRFEVEDLEGLEAALDRSPSLEREDGERRWVWSGKGRSREEPVVLGSFTLHERQLELSTNSVERGERGRKLLGRIAGRHVRHQLTVTEDAMGKVQRALAEGEPMPPPTLSSHADEQLRDITEEHYAEHYERWVDEEIPALDGRTPREAAAGSASERAKLIELLKDLEHRYEVALERGEAAYDPTWVRDELGLDAQLDAERGPRRAPRPAHAAEVEPMPAIVSAARTIVERVRGEQGPDFDAMISAADLESDLVARSFAREWVDTVDGAGEAAERRVWLETLCNFELHLRKLFWVDPSLGWMLGATDLELRGEELQLPFANFGIVFEDRYALGLAERMLSRERARLRGRMLRSLTVYLTQMRHGDVRLLRVAMACDAGDGRLPCVLVRELVLRPESSLEAILDSTAPGTASELEPVFVGSPARRLIHLVFNAILYASSVRPGAESSSGERGPSQAEYLESDSVYFLPGTIDIGSVDQLKRMRRSSRKRRSIMQRTMVRGHWRRAAAGWQDQRPRWIAPHWRGPTDAAIVEKDYRLEP